MPPVPPVPFPSLTQDGRGGPALAFLPVGVGAFAPSLFIALNRDSSVSLISVQEPDIGLIFFSFTLDSFTDVSFTFTVSFLLLALGSFRSSPWRSGRSRVPASRLPAVPSSACLPPSAAPAAAHGSGFAVFSYPLESMRF